MKELRAGQKDVKATVIEAKDDLQSTMMDEMKVHTDELECSL